VQDLRTALADIVGDCQPKKACCQALQQGLAAISYFPARY